MSEVYKATENKIKINTTSDSDVYKATKNAQITDTEAYKKTLGNKIQQDVAGKINHKFTPDFSKTNVAKTIVETKKPELKTTIPSRTYDESYVKELQLKNNMNAAKREYEETKANDDRNILVKFLQMGSDLSPVYYTKTRYDKAKKDYEDFKSAKYYSSLPNGTVKSTNPDKDFFKANDSIDMKYEYINDINNARNFVRTTSSATGSKNAYKIYDNMTDREIGIYNYLYETEGKNKAEEFLKFLETDLDALLNQDVAKFNKQFAEKFPILSSAASVAGTFASVGEQLKNYGEYLATGNMKTNKMSTATSTIRDTVSEKVDLEISNWDAFDFVYNTVMSGVDSFVAASSGPLGAVALGLSAAGSTTNDILARGGDSSQAFWGGAAAGVFEGFFEKFSIGQLNAMQEGTVKGFKDYALNLVKSMGVNFTEESATEVANILYDYAINGGISNYSIMVQEFVDSGDSLEVAKKKAAQQLGLQVLEAGASGALMGFGFASISSAASYKNASSIGKMVAANESESEVLNAALSMNGNTESYKMASEIKNSGEITTAKMGGLVSQIMSDISNQKSVAIETAVSERAKELGIDSKTAQKLTSYLTKAATNGKIESIEADNVGKNTQAQQIINEIKNNDVWAQSMNSQLSLLEKTEQTVRNAITLNTPETAAQSTPTTESEVESGVVPVEQSGEVLETPVVSQQERETVFTEPTNQEIYRDPTAEENAEAMFGRRKSAKQRHIIDVAKKLDSNMKVVFVDKNSKSLNGKNGKYNRDTNTMYIAKDLETNDIKLVEAYVEVFKHEFVHRLELRKAYKSFKDYLFNKSAAFEKYAKARLNLNDEVSGKDKTERTREKAINELVNMYIENINKDSTLSAEYKKNFTREKAEREAVADFVARTLFKGNTDDLRLNLESDKGEDFIKVTAIETDLEFFEEMASTDRTLLQKIIDAIRDLINSIKGITNLEKDLQYIEERLTRVYESADNKKTATESGEVLYSSDKPFEKQVDDVLNGQHNPRFDLYVSETPDIYVKLGFLNTPLLMRNSKINEILNDHPEMSPTIIKQIPEAVQNPILILKSKTHPTESVVAITDVITEKGNMIIPVWVNQEGNYIDFNIDEEVLENTNFVASAYGRNLKGLLEYADKNNGFLYQTENIKKVSELLARNELQLPTPLKLSDSDIIISKDNKNVKQKQLDIILGSNPAPNTYQTWVRSVDDIHTWEEVLQLDDEHEGQFVWGDFSRKDAEQALKDGTITVYSSYPIKNGVFVSTSNIQAQEYAGGESGKVYSKTIPLTEVAWINGDEGQYANVNESYSSDDLSALQEQLLDRYEKGEITREEYQGSIKKYFDDAIKEAEEYSFGTKVGLIKRNAKLHGKIKRQNEQLARRRSEISKEITAQREERATKQKNIEHIRKTVSRIDKMLRTNSDNKHVPEELKEEITKFVSVFVENDRSPFDKKDLRNIYLTYSDALRETSAEESNSSLDEDVLEDIKILRERLDGKTLRDLNYYETLLVRDIVDNFARIIKSANEMFIEGKRYQFETIGNTAMNELVSKNSKKENALTRAVDKGIVYNNMTPVFFFDKIGGVFKTLFDDVLNAQNKWFRNVDNSKTFITQMKEKYGYSHWGDDKLKLDTEKGDNIEITVEQAMLLYATAKREYSNKFQKSEHLFRGGVVIEPSKRKIEEVVKELRKASKEENKSERESKTKSIVASFTKEVDSRAHRITPADIVKIKNWLTDDQIDYMDAMVEYLSTDMAVLGNEISMELYGIKKYNEDYYIPYNSAQNFLYSQPGVNNEARLKHQSFTKNTVVGANNPLVLSDFSTVCADHINRMCMYNALTIPLENMNKIFNFENAVTGDMNQMSIKSEIERVYGEPAVTYINKFLEDMNGNVRVSHTDKAINRWISKFKKGAVFASASVVIQQPSSIIRAMAYIKPKYFTSTTFKFSERDYQECIKYAPVAGIKEMGRFDTGVGAATTNWLLQETPKGVKNKIKAFFDVSDSTYRDDKLSYFAAKADEITWGHIWAAVKSEIADTTDLKVGSREYFEACGKRFTDVINRTQVYDSTISRSQTMRDKSTGAQMLTAFMSEPTVSLNLLMNAAEQAKTGGKEGKRFAAGAVAAFVGSVALNSLLKSFVTAARDDDEEETYFEKYVTAATDNFLSDVFPPNLIPLIKDVVSICEGYTVERADMNLFSDLAKSISYLNSESKTDYEKFESVLGSLAAFLGLPVKNVLRDGRAVYNLCNDLFVNDKVDRVVNKEIKGYIGELSDNKTYKSFDDEDKEKLEKKITKMVRDVKEAEKDKQKRDKFDELYAEKRKSQKLYEKMRKEMLKEGYTSDEITAGVEIARIAYMKSIGIDVGEYLLYKIATNEKHADKDKSGGVSKQERETAIREMDIDEKIKNYFLNQHK